jgi:predicted nucleotidyltransferase
MIRCGEGVMDAELAPLIEKTVAALDAAGARVAYLFDSASKGKLRPNSDVDIAVSGPAPEASYRPMAKAGGALGPPVDLIDLDVENPFTCCLKDQEELERVG